MRKGITCLVWGMLFFLSGSSLFAQIHQPRQRFIEFGGGLADGVQVGRKDQTAYWVKASIGKYGKKEGIWALGFNGQGKYFQVGSRLMNTQQLFLEGTFAPRLVKTPDRSFYLNGCVGALIGYESADERELEVKLDKGMVGFTGGLVSEYNFSDRIALTAYAKSNFLPSSHIQTVHFQFGVGIRLNYFKR